MTIHTGNDLGDGFRRFRTGTAHKPIRRWAGWLAVGLSALLIAACGGGSGAAGSMNGAALPVGTPTIPPTDQTATTLSVTLTAPPNLASDLAGTVTVSASVPPNSSASAVDFQIDGTALGSAATAPYQAGLNAANYPSGQHVLRARARDATGKVSAWSSVTVSIGGSGDVMPGFTKNETWVSGLSNATAVAQAPDGRLFIAEQGGRLRVVKNGLLLSTAFVQLSVDSAGERGLIGVALHPNFASNGFVYLHYTTPIGGTHNRISRFIASGDVAAAGEAILVELPPLSSATNHNGGALHFGIDGKLYVGVGNNATNARSQDLTDPMGKILRFNDDGGIPADNPFFASQTGLARAIWARGLRNPFTFAVQPGTGRIHINDVGENTWEEIDLGVAGANYGWPASEGPDDITAGITAPLFAYKHSATNPPGSGPGGFFTGIAIAGGAFYPDTGNFPAPYHGNYFFADFGTSFIARLDLVNDNAAYAFAHVNGNPVDLLVGADGALYVLMRSGVARISAP